jgi:hypothetical protein
MRRLKFVGIRLILFGIVWIGVMGLIIFGLWNRLMPSIFGLPVISFWQALGLLVLSRVLLGRSGGWGRGWRGRRPRFAHGWNNLTPEERERFRRAMESRFGGKFGDDSGTTEKA